MSNDLSTTDWFYWCRNCNGAGSLATYADSYFLCGETLFENPTQAKLQRTALYTIASVAATVTSFLIKTALSTRNICVQNDCFFVSGILSLISAGCVFGAASIRDYEDRHELAQMKAKALSMTFQDLKKEHGLSTIQQYGIVEDLPSRFQWAYFNQTFNQMVNDTSLEEIARYGLCSEEYLHDKFELSYIASSFSEIVSIHSLNVIDQNGLSVLTETGFLHYKFMSELQDCASSFLRNRNLDNTLYTKILPAPMYHALVNIQNQILDADQILKRTLSDLDILFGDRTEMQQIKYLAREANIYYRAREFGRTVAARTPDYIYVYDPYTDTNYYDYNAGRTIADAAGKQAEKLEYARLYDEPLYDRDNPFNIARGIMQQQEYNYGVAIAYQTHNIVLAALDESFNFISEIFMLPSFN